MCYNVCVCVCVECYTHTQGSCYQSTLLLQSHSSVCQETLVCSWDEGIVQSVLNGEKRLVNACMRHTAQWRHMSVWQ